MKTHRILGTALLVLVLAGCATDDPNRRTKTGAAVGAIAGAIIGNQSGDDERFLGAAVGALAGATVGSYMDRQQRELDERLAHEQRRNALEITDVGADTLRVGIASDATFGFDRADIRARSRPTYDKIAGVLADYDRTVIHIVGHTDSTGSDTYNLGLSERRAQAVGEHLRDRGVSGERLVYYGMGERRAVASNDTEEGRARNRRVEIYIKPVVEGQQQAAYQPPPGIQPG